MRDHGNSGRPLLNDQGQVIGITSQIYADGSTSGNVGIGFAVPSATVQRLASELIANGKATHPYLGVYLEQASGGARIARVTSAWGSAATADPLDLERRADDPPPVRPDNSRARFQVARCRGATDWGRRWC